MVFILTITCSLSVFLGGTLTSDKAKRPESSADKLLPPSSPVTPTDKPVFSQPQTHEMEEMTTPQIYARRWVILILFVAYSFSNAYQWIHLNIIGNIVMKYYNESLPADSFQQETAIDWLSMIYMLCYIPLIFPATWLLNKKGLRTAVICGAFLNTLGAWLKCACLSPDRFPVLMFAQTICAIAQIFILGIPAQLAAVWFGPNQVSTATSIGVFGNQVKTQTYKTCVYTLVNKILKYTWFKCNSTHFVLLLRLLSFQYLRCTATL